MIKLQLTQGWGTVEIRDKGELIMALELADEVLMPPVPEEFHDLHKRTMKQIEADLSRWNQTDWAQLPGNDLNIDVREDIFIFDQRCDTQYCYAGHALVLAGYRLAVDTDGDLITLELKGNEWVPTEEDIHQLTEEVLGITVQQASLLYDTSDGDIEEFKAQMSALFGIDYD